VDRASLSSARFPLVATIRAARLDEDTIPATDRVVNLDVSLLVVRLIAGGVFVIFGIGKFTDHASELASFKAYGLPAPDAFVVIVGLIELFGGALLIAGLLTRPAALVLAGNMVGAIVVSGIAKGELISLTLAPAELVAMLVLLWFGPGAYSLGNELNHRRLRT
jgi:putative oxidoreductase